MDPEYADTNFRWLNTYLGQPTNALKTNQLQEFTKIANTGMQAIEVGPIDPEKWERQPKEHFKIMMNVARAAGIKPSVHGPIVDPAGFDDQSKGFSEETRDRNAEFFKSVLEKAQLLDPDGNVPITTHVVGMRTPGDVVRIELDEKGEPKKTIDAMSVAIPMPDGTAGIHSLQRKKIFLPGMKEPEFLSPDEQLKEVNDEQWKKQTRQLADHKHQIVHIDKVYLERAKDELKGKIYGWAGHYGADWESKITKADEIELEKLRREVETHEFKKKLLEEDVTKLTDDVYNRALLWKESPFIKPEHKKEYAKHIEAFQREQDDYFKLRKKIFDVRGTPEEERLKRENRTALERGENAMFNFIAKIGTDKGPIDKDQTPIFPHLAVKMNDFVKENASKTFADVAFHGYNKFGENSPIVSVENWQPNQPISQMEDMKETVERSRKLLAENLVAKKGLSMSDANRVAKKIIGTTLDIGHLNVWRRHMDMPEEKKDEWLMKEIEKIGPEIKHVHLHDNFGFSDVHLAPGDGSIPWEKMVKKLQESGKIEGKGVIGIVEHYGTSAEGELNMEADIPTLRTLNTPLYGWTGSPTWNEVGGSYFFGSGGYSPGYGNILPEAHYSMYGATFSQLPTSLGAAIQPGKKGEYSGTPMS
jgi:sugar phosphate isomerase/epimerase